MGKGGSCHSLATNYLDLRSSSNEEGDSSLNMIRTAIIGVGNCSSSLVQAVSMSHLTSLDSGLAFEKIGGYSVADIYFSAAFDVDKRKIGKDLSQAIFSEPNCTTKYVDVPSLGVTVACGALLDGVSTSLEATYSTHF